MTQGRAKAAYGKQEACPFALAFPDSVPPCQGSASPDVPRRRSAGGNEAQVRESSSSP